MVYLLAYQQLPVERAARLIAEVTGRGGPVPRGPPPAARLVRGQRTLRIPDTWPWAEQLHACLRLALALPPPT